MARPTPKALFQKLNKEAADALAMAVEERWFQTASTTAMAQMAENGASQEELRGARSFLDQLCTLHVEVTPVAPYPEKKLSSLEPPPEPTPEVLEEVK
jgi:hypothetical protein